jgi:hypothetical protein
MAIELTGTPIAITPNYNVDDDVGSQSISVPSDCTLIIASCYMILVEPSFTIFALGSTQFTETVRHCKPNTSVNGEGIVVEHLVNPSTGTQTLNWDTGVHVSQGLVILVAFYKGVDTTTPIKDYDVLQTTTFNYNEITGLTFDTGDMMVGFHFSYNADIDVTQNSQTQVVKSKAYGTLRDWGAMGQKLSTDTFGSYTTAQTKILVALILAEGAPEPTIYEGNFSNGIGFSDEIGGEQIVIQRYITSTFGLNDLVNTPLYHKEVDNVIGFSDSIDGELVSVICESASSFGLSELVSGIQVVVKKECLSVVGLNEFTNGVIAKYKASGTVTELGSPVARKVRLYRSSNGMFVDEAMSSSVDGTYDLFTPYNEEHYIVCLDNEEGIVYNPLANIAVLEGY